MLYSTLLKRVFRTLYGEPRELSETDDAEALVLIADGVGGLDLCGTGLRYVASSLQLPYRVRVVSWGHGFGRWYADLTKTENRDARARELAVEIAESRARAPATRVFLVGKSGGTGIVVGALERLEPDAVEAVVLLSPALSPGYDLARALTAVRREMVVFWSPFDVIVLGLGTILFGTIDRVRSVSAGLVGFRRPGPDDLRHAVYAKLRQVRWRPEMAATGYLGGHVGPDSPAFLKKYVVPLLRDAECPRC
jgi:hypothetical protein